MLIFDFVRCVGSVCFTMFELLLRILTMIQDLLDSCFRNYEHIDYRHQLQLLIFHRL